MSIRTIIIDDEANNLENLQTIIQQYCTDVDVIATARNADDGLLLIEQHKPDLVFLDIQMPGKSGFDLLAALPKINFEVIFITAYDKYGIRAIKFSALDYLLKPVDIDEFKTALVKAREKINAKKQNLNMENLLQYIKAGSKEPPKIALPTLKEIMYVKVTDIVRCEAANNYTTFYLQNNEQFLVCKTLKEFADLLKPHNFIRTHQSHLVNIDSVKSYLAEDGGTILLKNLEKVPISRQNRELVKIALNNGL
ncbi:LytTR family DNA-binding domain-containing protein [Mucilaginibacter sp. UR6-11]|uniref:LytR/AlgR family response regulator transcription factor n=1 Tax=Mucilaginibacter sp. UR6-11 TaxID=1435644 RepID=UPI001E568F16|nr:LytTR family DNA-binding domain-containing protein [Mucilaginibacter sp. UR6-11]MCC8426453.1 LytTR family DNA-binding domain-containing protein [Mucilaginibacter sp. UR6-11]